ncbi:MAG: DUF1614 domain-containing protein, partial [Mariprofundaceae bacterium]
MRGPFSPFHLLAFILLLVFLLVFVQLGLVSLAFGKLGLSTSQGMLLLFASLFGSGLNLPLTRIRADKPEPDLEHFMPHSLLRMPVMPFTGYTLIAVNAGGCLVPVVFSASLIHRFPLPLAEILLAVGIVAAICHVTSRPIPGIGIGMPPLIAPIAAALVAIFVNRELAAPLAYICGTLGVLIGADLLRLKDIAKMGTPIASIGG